MHEKNALDQFLSIMLQPDNIPIVGMMILVMFFTYLGFREARKNSAASLQCKIIEPTPVYMREIQYVIENAPHPYAALLFIEHMASPEGQKVIDDNEPVKSSIYGDGEVARAIKGKKIILNDFKTFDETPKWMKLVIEAYGFPREEKQSK